MDYWYRKHKDPEFLELRDYWWKKAREYGLLDIEIVDNRTGEPGDMLQGPSSGDLYRSTTRRHQVQLSENQFRAYRNWTYTDSGRPRLSGAELSIWEAFCEGLSPSKIHRLLGQRLGWSKGRVANFIRETRTKALLWSQERYAQEEE